MIIPTKKRMLYYFGTSSRRKILDNLLKEADEISKVLATIVINTKKSK